MTCRPAVRSSRPPSDPPQRQMGDRVGRSGGLGPHLEAQAGAFDVILQCQLNHRPRIGDTARPLVLVLVLVLALVLGLALVLVPGLDGPG